MKKLAFAFDIMIIGLLFANTSSSNTFIKADLWNSLTPVILIVLSGILLLTGILKRYKSEP